MGGAPVRQFNYVMLQGEGNKGASYKYAWKPDWRMPPGVKGSQVLLQVIGILGIAAIPVYVWPFLNGPAYREQESKKVSKTAQAKQKAKEERMKWISSDDMPRR
ncbi:MAG: hypothetical protein WDW38_005958 [Sanguina aurantia]